jgi:hypothetical protein
VNGPAPANPAAPPSVPKYGSGGSGQTVVNTQALDTFAANMKALVGPVQDAHTKLANLNPLQIGTLYESTALEGKVNTASGSTSGGASGLVDSYKAVLEDLANGLTDLSDAATQMSQKYNAADELNGLSVTDLQNSLNQTEGYFSNMMTANGGTAPATTPTTPTDGQSGGSQST